MTHERTRSSRSKFIHPGGTTPEGLCFEAIQKKLIASAKDLDSYFINFSDGEPYFESQGLRYFGMPAQEHTRQQVKSMTDKGIKVLSYFINDYEGSNLDFFKKMYGPSAERISVDSLIPLSKSLNKMFA